MEVVIVITKVLLWW